MGRFKLGRPSVEIRPGPFIRPVRRWALSAAGAWFSTPRPSRLSTIQHRVVSLLFLVAAERLAAYLLLSAYNRCMKRSECESGRPVAEPFGLIACYERCHFD